MTTVRTGVHISDMIGKLEGFKAISTNTVTNEFCKKMNADKRPNSICGMCYSHAMLGSYRKNMQPALQHNSDLLASRPLDDRELPTILDEVFRISAHGELINMQHLLNIVSIVRHNPHCTFTMWTKRKDIVGKFMRTVGDKPDNLILMYSNPRINAPMLTPPKYFDKVFNNVTYDQHVERQNCTGQKCKDCLHCYKWDGDDVIFEATKLNGRTIKQ